MNHNPNFGKFTDGVFGFAPVPLSITTHHHEEWDEPVFDPGTGEPVIDPETGEQKTEHVSRDWDTTETLIHPKKTDFARAGHLPVVDKPPEEPAHSGHHWEPTDGYAERDGIFRREYHAVANQPREFSKHKLELALFKDGLLPAVDAYIDSQTLTNERGETMALRRAYDTALTLREDNQYFEPFLEGVKTALGLSDETVESELAASVAD